MMVVDVADEQWNLADLAGEVIECLQAFRYELGFKHQILGRVADEGQLRGDHEVSARIDALAVCGEDALHIAGEVSDGWIDLGDADVHARLEKTPESGFRERKIRGDGI